MYISPLCYVHVVQPVRFYRVIIEPGAVTCFPLVPAHHAELGSAPTGHMVTTFLEFDHS
jgi:hypothetical protein